ncbi:MAG: VanR-ABDEGLN family response regulator transcription factor [Erysipelotrichaceae bacterium]|nr:VanR-ABDEGLN family response regulator transcription factor [Erysipelotrichaceae bacterium]MDY5252644.1 VanR-ABDEGLN family response regulator transcription factor [Erysipelotrichaceae bacterium]
MRIIVMEKILIVDDELEIAQLLEICLKNEGYEVVIETDGQQALENIQANEYDLALLDIMLPKVSGLQLCQKIREKSFYPVIMLTAKNMDSDKIIGLTMGADDYITKPFNPLEVLARIKSQLRRYKRYNHVSEEMLEVRGLSIDEKKHKCYLFEKELSLTPIEFNIILYLLKNRGKVVSSEELFEAVWQEKYFESNNTVMAHIARIREKMKEPARNPQYIKTVWGIGYTIE